MGNASLMKYGGMEPADTRRKSRSHSTHSPESPSLQHTPRSKSTAPQNGRLKLPEISQFTIACYAGFIALAALYVAHSSANTSADVAILANKIAIAGVSQAQVSNQIQLLQLCLLNSTLLSDICGGVLDPAASQLPKIAALTTFQYETATVNDDIEARFVRELMGFHIGFFSLLAFAVIHGICSLWKPVREYARHSREMANRSVGEVARQGSKDLSLDQRGGKTPCPIEADQDRCGQRGDLERQKPLPSSPPFGNGADWGGASVRRHISPLELEEKRASGAACSEHGGTSETTQWRQFQTTVQSVMRPLANVGSVRNTIS